MNMKKSLLMFPLAALTLVACGPAGFDLATAVAAIREEAETEIVFGDGYLAHVDTKGYMPEVGSLDAVGDALIVSIEDGHYAMYGFGYDADGELATTVEIDGEGMAEAYSNYKTVYENAAFAQVFVGLMESALIAQGAEDVSITLDVTHFTAAELNAL